MVSCKQVDLVYQPHSGHFPFVTDPILTAFTDRLYQPHTNHILTKYWPYTDHVLIKCRPHTDHLYRPCTDHILTDQLVHNYQCQYHIEERVMVNYELGDEWESRYSVMSHVWDKENLSPEWALNPWPAWCTESHGINSCWQLRLFWSHICPIAEYFSIINVAKCNLGQVKLETCWPAVYHVGCPTRSQGSLVAHVLAVPALPFSRMIAHQSRLIIIIIIIPIIGKPTTFRRRSKMAHHTDQLITMFLLHCIRLQTRCQQNSVRVGNRGNIEDPFLYWESKTPKQDMQFVLIGPLGNFPGLAIIGNGMDWNGMEHMTSASLKGALMLHKWPAFWLHHAHMLSQAEMISTSRRRMHGNIFRSVRPGHWVTFDNARVPLRVWSCRAGQRRSAAESCGASAYYFAAASVASTDPVFTSNLGEHQTWHANRDIAAGTKSSQLRILHHVTQAHTLPY